MVLRTCRKMGAERLTPCRPNPDRPSSSLLGLFISDTDRSAMADFMKVVEWLFALLQMAVFVAAAPLFSAWIKRVKCWLQNRRSPPLNQPYKDLRRLFSKQVLLAHTASALFRTAPYL